MPWGTLWSFVTTTPDDFVLPGEGYYAMYPAFHVSGKAMLYQATHYLARMVIREQFSIQHFWADVREFGIAGAGLVGPMAPFLMMAPEQPDDADSPLRHVMMGPLVPQVDEFKRRFGVEVGTGYGMTEIGAPFASDGYALANNKSCGKLRAGWAGYEAQIVDEHDQPLGPDEVGELVVRAREPWVINRGLPRHARGQRSRRGATGGSTPATGSPSTATATTTSSTASRTRSVAAARTSRRSRWRRS